MPLLVAVPAIYFFTLARARRADKLRRGVDTVLPRSPRTSRVGAAAARRALGPVPSFAPSSSPPCLSADTVRHCTARMRPPNTARPDCASRAALRLLLRTEALLLLYAARVRSWPILFPPLPCEARLAHRGQRLCGALSYILGSVVGTSGEQWRSYAWGGNSQW